MFIRFQINNSLLINVLSCFSHLAKECFVDVPTCTTEFIEGPSLARANIVDIDTDFEGATAHELIQYHFGAGAIPIPVYCADSKPFDLQSALENTVQCPVKYLSKVPPTMVTDNYCFVVDGDIVSLDEITQESSQWWKDTSTTTKYYSSEDVLRTFHQINVLTSRGEIRSAYRTMKKGGGMKNVTLEKVFKVQRYFSYWTSCKSFHRIISVVNPVTKEGEVISGFQKRIFIQYLWRTDRESDRQRVANEYILRSKTRVGASISSTSFSPKQRKSRASLGSVGPVLSSFE
ncbi:hypothetical protein L596_002776 [Steinernema carpocapsae]|uniref:Uncharacterized protein n=1 Tax=Steinernema carpocapsae TaxID=34508 RepID=A0A4U8UQK1_STECR|nr:hypothetical protein L596_002776 [Steinernema carpocapsae]